nr:MAG TPA: hypothetical protein [Caudoviricetes sp.]
MEEQILSTVSMEELLIPIRDANILYTQDY